MKVQDTSVKRFLIWKHVVKHAEFSVPEAGSLRALYGRGHLSVTTHSEGCIKFINHIICCEIVMYLKWIRTFRKYRIKKHPTQGLVKIASFCRNDQQK